MGERAMTRMSSEEFLAWGLLQDRRYELVDGVPAAMAGATRRHDRIVANVHGMLFAQLRGEACQNFTADTAVRIPGGNIRRPDAGMDCGAFDDSATTAAAPFLILEVLSPSTRDFDLIGKLEEYKTIIGLAHIVVIDPDIPQVFHWSRQPEEGRQSKEGRQSEEGRQPGEDRGHVLLEGLMAVVAMPEIGCTLDLATLYEGLTFRPAPRLMRESGSSA